MTDARRRRVLFVLSQYPQLSESYIKVEVEHIARANDVAIVATGVGHDPYCDALPYTILGPELGPLVDLVDEFRPDVLHAHWLKTNPAVTVARLSAATDIPFTIRSHSFDVLWGGARGALFDRAPVTPKAFLPDWLRRIGPLVNDEHCLGVLGFPFARRRLERMGIRPEKIHETYPVVDVERFADRSPNGDGVMGCGVTTPKKDVDAFPAMATMVPERSFRYYSLGSMKETLEAANAAHGAPVEIAAPVEHRDMPREYKRHEWLLFTGRHEQRSVGWPVAVAEAQAAGVGVCMPRLRPDLEEYVGDAGYLYSSPEEGAAIVRGPFDPDRRTLGFDLAARSDVRNHLHVLTDLWPDPTR